MTDSPKHKSMYAKPLSKKELERVLDLLFEYYERPITFTQAVQLVRSFTK